MAGKADIAFLSPTLAPATHNAQTKKEVASEP
jgi:hypothetical protein